MSFSGGNIDFRSYENETPALCFASSFVYVPFFADGDSVIEMAYRCHPRPRCITHFSSSSSSSLFPFSPSVFNFFMGSDSPAPLQADFYSVLAINKSDAFVLTKF